MRLSSRQDRYFHGTPENLPIFNEKNEISLFSFFCKQRKIRSLLGGSKVGEGVQEELSVTHYYLHFLGSALFSGRLIQTG